MWSTSHEHIATLANKVSILLNLKLFFYCMQYIQESLACEEKAFLLLFSGSCLQLVTIVEERDSLSKIIQVNQGLLYV